MPLLKVNQIASYSGNTLTIGTTGDTVTLAAGASVSGFGFDGVVWTSNIVTSALTVSANVGYFVNTSSAAITVTLPASASNGDQIIFTDYNRKFATNNLTLNPNSLKFQGNTSPNPVYSTDGQTIQLVYADSIQGWIPISDDDVTLETPQSYSIDFLVVAGGAGGGGSNYSGGGGAGGYRTSTQSVIPGTVITVTVGDGGAAVASFGLVGNSGSNSSISGSGLTTITSAGGGGGGSNPTPNTAGIAGSGGSGGGSTGYETSTTFRGLGNTPSTSPSQGNNGGVGGNYGAGGGGGAGAAGSAGTAQGGAGGVGVASSITGSSVYYAGGGGGGTNSGSGGAGGNGGGGTGSTNLNTGRTNGTANTGGGGGGTANDNPGSTGGKGVVILSVPTISYSGTSSGSPTITTSGSNTILQFNGSGSYTA